MQVCHLFHLSLIYYGLLIETLSHGRYPKIGSSFNKSELQACWFIALAKSLAQVSIKALRSKHDVHYSSGASTGALHVAEAAFLIYLALLAWRLPPPKFLATMTDNDARYSVMRRISRAQGY